jgi:hypothetical protein
MPNALLMGRSLDAVAMKKIKFPTTFEKQIAICEFEKEYMKIFHKIQTFASV